MKATRVHQVARRLYQARGFAAIAEAAQKAAAYEQDHQEEPAHLCRRIKMALLEMRGPRST